MADNLVRLALLGPNFLLFWLRVAKVRVLDPLEGLRHVFDALDLKQERLGQVGATLERRVKPSRAKKKLKKVGQRSRHTSQRLAYLFNRSPEDNIVDLGLRKSAPLFFK